MMCLRQKITALIRQLLAVVIAITFVGTAMTAMASTGPVTWTSEADFESNTATVGTSTNRTNIDTTSSPGDVKIGIAKDFVTTATITCVTSLNKIYTTGVDRNSIAVINSTTMALIRTIPLPGPVAGIVYNSTNNKLYVGQSNINTVSILDVATDTIINTLTIGTAVNGAYAAAYNPTNNKVYLANTGDQTVTILDGASDTPLEAPLKVTAGATTATYDAIANKLYLTGKSNNYLTIIDGVTDQVVQDIQVQPVLSILGGQATGNVGLRVDAQSLGFTNADNVQLSWNADSLGPNQNIQFQVRTARDIPSLDTATYGGPDGTADTWYDLSTAGVSSVTQDDGTVTNAVQLNIPFAAAAELQLKLSYDGISSPVLHQVSLTYDFTITASAGNGGSISPSGPVTVPFGGSQTFAISPNTGYHIVDVSVDGVSQGAIGSYTFSDVRANHTIAATFAINTCAITATAGQGGSISPPGAVTANYGSSPTFTITPDTGYHIADVSVDGVSQGAIGSYTFNTLVCPANHTITATFAINTYTITATAGNGGIISPAGVVTVNYDGNQTFNITANNGYYITSVLVDGVSQGSISSYTFSHVRANHTITATFAIDIFTITATAGQGGTISPPGNVTAHYGDNVTFTITPNTGCSIASLTVDGVSVAVASTYTFNAISNNHTISVTFIPSSSATLVQTWMINGPTNFCYGGALDNAGNFYCGDYLSNNVYRLNPSKVVDWASTSAYAGGTGQVAVDNMGNVYSFNVSTLPSGTLAAFVVNKFTPPATTDVWQINLPNPYFFNGGAPRVISSDMVVDNKGYLYVAAIQNNANNPSYVIYKINTSNGTIVWTGSTPFTSRWISGLVVDSQGKIYVTSYSSSYPYVYKFDPTAGSNPVATFPLSSSGNGPIYLAIDNSDKIYVQTPSSFSKIDTSGNVSWSKALTTPYYDVNGGNTIATDGVNVYVSGNVGLYLTVYDAVTGNQKQNITNVNSYAAGGTFTWVATDGFGTVYVSNPSTLSDPITRFHLQ